MKILTFPVTHHNHYQELLYGEMRKEGDVVTYIPSPFIFLPQIVFARLFGYEVIHIHWTSAFSIPTRMLTYWHYRLCLKAIKGLGYKLVWTAHNVLPHEHIFPDDVKARRDLIKVTDLVISHSQLTLEGLRGIGAEPKHVVVIPHGSYVGAYPNTISRAEARKQLGIDPDTFVYLHLGWAKGYKGIEDLTAAYEKIKSPANTLILAGKGFPTGYIPDEDLQKYFNAADVAVFPFKNISTSGSVLLALSFGTPVIVPRLGDLKELPDTMAYKYSPEDSEGLLGAMKEAQKNPATTKEMSKAAAAYAEELRWPAIARRTRAAMMELFK